MNSFDDDELIEALADLGTPAHRPGYGQRLMRELERSDWSGLVSRPRGRRRPWRLLAVAALASVAVAVVLVGVRMPGESSTGVEPASAAERLYASINAGLTSVSTMQGTLDTFVGGRRTKVVHFAMTAAGDQRIEVTRLTDWAEERRDFERTLKLNHDPDPRDSSDPVVRSALRRGVSALYTYDAQSHVLQEKIHLVDLHTLRSWGDAYQRVVHYPMDAYWSSPGHLDVGGGLDTYGGEAWDYRRMSFAVGAALQADSQGVSIDTTTLDGRPVYHAVFEAGLEPRDESVPSEAWVDQETGIVLRVDTNAPYDTSLRLRRFTLNEPLKRSLFTMTPSYDLDPEGGLPAPSQPSLEQYTLDAGAKPVSLADLQSEIGFRPGLPSWVPDGYQLSGIYVPTKEGIDDRNHRVVNGDGVRPVLVYRNGLSSFCVNLAEKYRCPITIDTPKGESPIAIDPQNVTLEGGIFKGLEVATSQSVPWEYGWRLWASGPSLAAGVDGDITTEQALRVLGSFAFH